MEELNEEIIDAERVELELPSSFKVMSILSYIGNGLMAAVFLFLGIAGLTNTGFLGDVDSSYGMTETAIMIFVITGLVLGTLSVLSIISISKMSKKQKSGWLLYVITNAIWILLIILSYIGRSELQTMLTLLVSVGFFVYFVRLKKYLY